MGDPQGYPWITHQRYLLGVTLIWVGFPRYYLGGVYRRDVIIQSWEGATVDRSGFIRDLFSSVILSLIPSGGVSHRLAGSQCRMQLGGRTANGGSNETVCQHTLEVTLVGTRGVVGFDMRPWMGAKALIFRGSY